MLLRRDLLQGQWSAQPLTIRPPWSVEEVIFVEQCTRCHRCIAACESTVITMGSGGFPQLDFNRAECTFCQRCAEACPLPLFDLNQPIPWQYTAQLADGCLAHQQVECHCCKEICETSAIGFERQLGKVALPIIDSKLCSGCGACVKACPVGVIFL